jgi:hypothetical protein
MTLRVLLTELNHLNFELSCLLLPGGHKSKSDFGSFLPDWNNHVGDGDGLLDTWSEVGVSRAHHTRESVFTFGPENRG